MIPQSTPLYLVTAYTIDGEPCVSNELVIGWVRNPAHSAEYVPFTVAVNGTITSITASPAPTAEQWKAAAPSKAWSFGSQLYSTTPLTLDDLDRLYDTEETS